MTQTFIPKNSFVDIRAFSFVYIRGKEEL